MASLKSLAKDTAIYGLSSIIGRFLNYLLVPLYTAKISAASGGYGVITNMYAYTALLLVILTYGMETTFFRFVNKEGENSEKVYHTVLSMVGFTSLLFIALVFLFITPLSDAMGYADHPAYVWTMFVTVAIDAFQCIPFAYLRYKKRPLKFAAFKLLFIGLNIALNLVYYVIMDGHDVGYAFYINLVCTASITFCFYKELKEGFMGEKCSWSECKVLVRKMLGYSWPILVLGIAGILNQTADKILFPFLFEDKAYANEQLGIYGACFKIAVVMVMFTQAFRYAYEPFIFARNKSEDNKLAYAEAMKYFILFALFIFLGVMFYIDILKYFVGPAYYPGLRAVPIVMLGELFFGIYFNLSLWYKLIDETRWGAYFSSIGCVATVTIILLFGSTYGYMACAWASFCCNLLMMVLSYFMGQRKYPINYDLRSAAVYTALATVLYVAGMYLPIESIIGRLAYRTLLLAVYAGFMWKRDLMRYWR